MALSPAADAAGFEVLETINVRLLPGRIPIPDLVVASDIEAAGVVVDSANVLLICEITSPSNAAADRLLKMHYYAEAGMEWYLLIDPDGPTMQLFHHDNGHYALHATATPGTPLAFPAPLTVSVDPASLVRTRS